MRPKGYKNQVLDQHYYIKRLEAELKELEKEIMNKSELVRQSGAVNKLTAVSNDPPNKRTESSRAETVSNHSVEKEESIERIIREERSVNHIDL